MSADPYRKRRALRSEGKVLLAQLAKFAQPVTVAHIAHVTDKVPQSIRKTLNSAEAQGYAASVQGDDGIEWRITESGRALVGLQDIAPTIHGRPVSESDMMVARTIRTQPRWIFDAALF